MAGRTPSQDGKSPAARRQVLREILATRGPGKSHTQDALRTTLRRRGFDVTQSTVSRDLRAVGARRELAPSGPARWALPSAVDAPSPRLPAAALLLAVLTNDHLVVVKTRAACAGTVASALDQAKVAGVLGTVAGDDTILVAPEVGVRPKTLARRVREALVG